MYQHIYIYIQLYIYIYIQSIIIFPYYLDVYLLYIYAWFCDRITKSHGDCENLLSDWILSPMCFGENQGFHCRLVRSPAAVFRKKNKRMPSREMMSRPSAVPVRFPMGFWGILRDFDDGFRANRRFVLQKIGWLPSWFLKHGFWEIHGYSDIPIDDTWGFSDFSWIQLLSGRQTLGVHKSYQMRPKKRERWEIKWWFSGSRYGFDRWFDVKRNTDYMGSNYEWTMIYHGDIEWYSL